MNYELSSQKSNDSTMADIVDISESSGSSSGAASNAIASSPGSSPLKKRQLKDMSPESLVAMIVADAMADAKAEAEAEAAAKKKRKTEHVVDDRIVPYMGQPVQHGRPDVAAGTPINVSPLRTTSSGVAQPVRQEPATSSQKVENNNNEEKQKEELKPHPFFYYNDHSKDVDPDPLASLTPPGRVPNFPAKMHAILTRPDLADIVCWMPHGRSWRVLKPREFEVKVLPTYFEHAKFSSFIRQANGWGFRRITQGRDRNSYYHECFLRGLPHLCKKMKRPAVSEKQAADPDHEPDFYKICELHPVPERPDDDSILLHCIINGGPKARMPIYSGSYISQNSFNGGTNYGTSSSSLISSTATATNSASIMPSLPSLAPSASSGLSATHSALGNALSLATSGPLPSSTQRITPRDEEALSAFQMALGASEQQFGNLSFAAASNNKTTAPPQAPVQLFAPSFAATAHLPMMGMMTQIPASAVPQGGTTNAATAASKLSTLAAANQLAFAATPSFYGAGSFAFPNPGAAAFSNAGAAAATMDASAQFAAGFAAATALSQQQFRSMMFSAAMASNSAAQQQHQFSGLP